MLLHFAPAASSAQVLLAMGGLVTLIFVIAAIVSDLQGVSPRVGKSSRRRAGRRR